MKLESSFVPQPFASSTKTGCRRRGMVAVRVALIGVAIFLCQGCLVMPVRAPTRTNGNSGAMEKISLDFLHSGKTTKDEVTTKLGGTDTGIRDKQLFVGRWATSHSGVLSMVAANNSGAGGWSRAWASQTVLGSFEDRDTVQQF